MPVAPVSLENTSKLQGEKSKSAQTTSSACRKSTALVPFFHKKTYESGSR